MSKELIPPAANENASIWWQKLLKSAGKLDKKQIILPPGKYDFFPEGCTQRYAYFSNNDEGVKTIAFDLFDLTDFTLSGSGAELIFHGRISPIVACKCRNLTISGITIDFEDSFVSDADLIRRADGIAWFKIGGKHSFADGKIIFSGDFFDNLDGKLNFFSFNTILGELNSDVAPVSIENRDLLFENDLIGVPDKFPSDSENFVIKHELRLCPGIVFDQCENVRLENVKLHHAAGMGVLAQCCKNVTLENVEISPRNRRCSVSDDAAHIVECRGKIVVRNCDFAGTLDDSINIHGIYRPLKFRIPGGKFYYLDSGHYQQMGLPGAQAGDTLELCKAKTSRPYGKIKLTDAKVINKAFTKVVFDEATLPTEYEWGDIASVVECQNAVVVVENCRFRPFKGRGVLVSGVKEAIIRGCDIHSSGAGIFISGDPNFWFESGPVKNLLIENNRFDNCCYSNVGSTREAICVFPEIVEKTDDFCYHGTIIIRNNSFISSLRPLISMLSVENAVVVDNDFTLDNTYRFAPKSNDGYFFTTLSSPRVNFRNCGKTEVDGNKGF